ncbi:MAG: protein kinase [Armatimonadetes bacterium]|nr:protein kinase [Anaerolineae bacterium]
MKNRKFGKYEVLQRLGRGGMAEVYRAYHPNLDRYVAIKVLHSFLSDDGDFRVRFEREAQNIAKLKHPNIVQVYDFDVDTETDSYFMVMELIEGPTLKDYLWDTPDAARRLDLEEALRITRQAAEALAYAHQRGMIHRDVKPANLMLDAKDNNRVVLTDFGIAKLMTSGLNTMSGGLVGTPAYMSPEQGMGEGGDERSDLYALGVMLYQMLTGDLPYDSETPMGLILQHMNDPIPLVRLREPHLPPAVDKVLQKLMAKLPAERYQNAPAFIEDLDLLEKAPARLDPTTLVLPRLPLVPLEKPAAAIQSSARRVPVALIALLLGLLIIVGGVYAVGVNNGMFPAFALVAAAPTATATPTPSSTVTAAETVTETATEPGTSTATLTVTQTRTSTPTATRTYVPTDTHTAAPTLTLTVTSISLTSAPTRSATRAPSATVTSTVTAIATPTATLTATVAPSVTQTPAPDLTLTAAIARTATTTACNFDYAVIEQAPENGEDGGFFHINANYCRKIRLLNTGTCSWDRNTSLTFVTGSGESFNAGPRIFIEAPVEPAQEVALFFEGALPSRGSVDPISGLWQLLTPGQLPIGAPFEISLLVFDPGSGYETDYACPE